VPLPSNPNHPYYQRPASSKCRIEAPLPERSERPNLPDNLASLSIEALDLSVRSRNALRNNSIRTLGQLVLLSDDQLIEFKNLGLKSLTDVHRALDEFVAEHTEEIKTQQSAIRKGVSETSVKSGPVRSTGGWLVPRDLSSRKNGQGQPTSDDALDDLMTAPVEVLDLSTRALNTLKRLRIISVEELLAYPKHKIMHEENFGIRSLNEIESKTFGYLSSGLENGDNTRSVEEELRVGTKSFVDQMLSRLFERQRSVVIDRYGLWDGIAETLQDIGDKLGVTRERIRQIEDKGLKRLRRVNSRVIDKFVLSKIRTYVGSQNDNILGILSKDEIANAFADDCTSHEAMLAVTFLQDVNASLFAKQLFEAEPGVYCHDKESLSKYKALLEAIERALHNHQKPIPEERLYAELTKDEKPLSDDQRTLLKRLLQISPSVIRLRNGSVGLSEWMEFHRRDATSLAEAALRLLGRPTHFREIAQKISVFFPDAGTANERTIHQIVSGDQRRFVWVKHGTYGLAAWGLKRAPFIKDRLIELLSESSYPLPYWHLKEKVLEVCNCKELSVRMTLDLNPKVFKKFDPDQYSLRKHYQ